jgi:protein TonB
MRIPQSRALRWSAFVAAVLALHGAALWALQLGLMRHTADAAPAASVIAVMVSRAVLAPQPAAMPPSSVQPPVKMHAELQPVSKPAQAAALPRPWPVPVQPTPSSDQPVQTAPPVSGSVAQTALAPSAPVTSTSADAGGAQTKTVSANHETGLSASAQGGVVLPSADAAYLHNPPPDYPPLSRLRRESGTVTVRALIGVNGRAQRAWVEQSSGYARLDDEALVTARDRWSYQPGTRAGVPEAMLFDVPIEFVLEN